MLGRNIKTKIYLIKLRYQIRMAKVINRIKWKILSYHFHHLDLIPLEFRYPVFRAIEKQSHSDEKKLKSQKQQVGASLVLTTRHVSHVKKRVNRSVDKKLRKIANLWPDQIKFFTDVEFPGSRSTVPQSC